MTNTDAERVSDIVAELRELLNDDHERGCQGREYTCSCGYDVRWGNALGEAADIIEAQSKALAEANGTLKYCEAQWSDERGTMIDKLQDLRAQLEEARDALKRKDNTYTSLAMAGNPSIPTAMFNVADLLKQIAEGRDPNDNISDAHTLLDYWQTTARTFLPALVASSPLDEEFSNLLVFARQSASTLRQIRQEHRSRSANFPSMVPVPYAQDAAEVIERLVRTIEARALTPTPENPNG